MSEENNDEITQADIAMMNWLEDCPVDACAVVAYIKDGKVKCTSRMMPNPTATDKDRMMTEDIRLFIENKGGNKMYFNSPSL